MPKVEKLQPADGNLQSIKNLLTLELSQYHKSGSVFSSSEPVAASSAVFLKLACCCQQRLLPSTVAQAELESCPKSLAVDFVL